MFFFPDGYPTSTAFTHWRDEDAIVFGFFNGELFYVFGDTHQHLKVRLQQNNVIPLDNEENARKLLSPSGRYWSRSRCLSFWNVPTYDELKKVVDEMGVPEDALVELDGWNEDDVFTIPEALETLKGRAANSPMSPEEWRKMAAVQHLVPDAKKALVGSHKDKVGSGKLASVATQAGFKSAAEYTAASRQSEGVTRFLDAIHKTTGN